MRVTNSWNNKTGAPALQVRKSSFALSRALKQMKKRWQFYLLISVPVLYIVIFCYVPMPGVLMAFQRFSPTKGLLGSPWVGLQHFKQFLSSPSSLKIIWNTLQIGLVSVVAGFPIPILLAIALNESKAKMFKKTVQMVTYAPYFISTVVLVGIIQQVTDPRLGVINLFLNSIGMSSVNFTASPDLFTPIYVISGIWQGAGYSSIIYLAALSAVDQEVQEAAIVDGTSRLQRIWHVDLPAISQQIIILLIFNVGNLINIGFEKIFLMQNTLNISKSEVISTFVYKVGLINADYSFSTAVGLFNSAVSLILLLGTNWVAKKFSDTGIW